MESKQKLGDDYSGATYLPFGIGVSRPNLPSMLNKLVHSIGEVECYLQHI